jgi:hypothetical protein
MEVKPAAKGRFTRKKQGSEHKVDPLTSDLTFGLPCIALWRSGVPFFLRVNFLLSIILWHPPVSVVNTPISHKKFKKSNNQRLDPLGSDACIQERP